MQLKVERFHVYIEVHKYNSYLNGWRPYIQLFILTTTFFYKLQLYNLRIPWILLELIPPHTQTLNN